MAQKFTIEQIIEAIKATKGMVYVAARQLHCHPTTIYNYAKRYPSVQRAIDDERGFFLDTCELALAKAVANGEAWAICFSLKTLGKHRGYVERQEITGKDGGEIVVRYVNNWRDQATESASGSEDGRGQREAVAVAGRGKTLAEDHASNGHSR